MPRDQVTAAHIYTGDGPADDVADQVITQLIPVQNIDAKDVAAELTPLMSKGGSLVGSSSTNALIVTDSATTSNASPSS